MVTIGNRSQHNFDRSQLSHEMHATKRFHVDFISTLCIYAYASLPYESHTHPIVVMHARCTSVATLQIVRQIVVFCCSHVAMIQLISPLDQAFVYISTCFPSQWHHVRHIASPRMSIACLLDPTIQYCIIKPRLGYPAMKKKVQFALIYSPCFVHYVYGTHELSFR